MLELNWTIEGEKQLSRRLNILTDKIKDFKPEFQESADFLKGVFEGEVFSSRGALIGEPWKSTGNPWPILEKSGRMRRSFRTRAEALRGEVWNATDYFKYHQSREPRRKLPRRVMMKLIDQFKDKIIQIFHKGINYRLKESNV